VSATEAGHEVPHAAGELQLEGGETVPFDALIVAAGRRPDSSALQLDRANVRTNEHGYVSGSRSCPERR
jgi:pyruvate/2-oxoglutarate dehydrogenase complex dihydrolipoamide dehydrogenase (E3) component